MSTPAAARRRTQGTTLIEVLVAAMILAIAVMGMASLWTFSFTTTTRTDDRAIAYNLGRQSVETAKRTGFYNLAEGTTTTYYDGLQQVAPQASARFSVTRAVVSSLTWPNNKAYRMVLVSVRRTSTSQTLYSTNTILVRGGV